MQEAGMDYIKIRFVHDIGKIGSRVEKTIEDMFRSINPPFSLSERIWKPQVDIYETPEKIIVLAEIPGVDKEALVIEISNKALKIYGERKGLPIVEDTYYRLAEIQYGSFERTLFFPVLINTEMVTASYSNGLLQIQMGKLSLDKTQKIEIK